MRTFYEEWKMLDTAIYQKEISNMVSDNLELADSKNEKTEIMTIWNLQVLNSQDFPLDAFLHTGWV